MKKVILVTSLFAMCLAVSIGGARPSDAETGSEKSSITFSRDVAPILQKRCEECHRHGGMAPMSLVTYEEARPWARSIKEKTVKREMPPFHAAGQAGRYVNDPRLTDAEIATIAKWVDAGASRGNPKDMPAPRRWKDDWVNGEPDLIVTVQHP